MPKVALLALALGAGGASSFAQQPASVPAVTELRASSLRPGTLRPGENAKILDDEAGALGYYMVSVPRRHDRRRSWPVVFYYHGLGGQPDTVFLRSLLPDTDFIIVGMGYYQRGMAGYQHLPTHDTRILFHVLDTLDSVLRIDRDRLFIAGFSRGGFYASGLLNRLPDLWAGAVILNAGVRVFPPDPAALRDKPVFIGWGEHDFLGDDARDARDYYQALNCRVTHEQWSGIGHSIGQPNGIARWLLEHSRPAPVAPPAEAGAKTGPEAHAAPDGQPAAADPQEKVPWLPIALSVAGVVAVAMVGVAVVDLWRRRNKTANLPETGQPTEDPPAAPAEGPSATDE